MTDQQKPVSTVGQLMPVVVACVLIGSFLYRAVTPAHEYPLRTEQVVTMLLDLALLVGLIGTRSRIPKALFWAALVAGIGLFLIRLNSDASWWTGHLGYSLLPR
jgi:hypothetical protein